MNLIEPPSCLNLLPAVHCGIVPTASGIALAQAALGLLICSWNAFLVASIKFRYIPLIRPCTSRIFSHFVTLLQHVTSVHRISQTILTARMLQTPTCNFAGALLCFLRHRSVRQAHFQMDNVDNCQLTDQSRSNSNISFFIC